MKQKLLWLLKTHLGRLALSAALVLLFAILYRTTWDFWKWFIIPPAAYIVAFSAAMLVYGLIINPYKDWKKRKQ